MLFRVQGHFAPVLCKKIPHQIHQIRTCCELFFAPVCKSMENWWFVMLYSCRNQKKISEDLATQSSPWCPGANWQPQYGPMWLIRGRFDKEVFPVGCRYFHWKFANEAKPNKSRTDLKDIRMVVLNAVALTFSYIFQFSFSTRPFRKQHLSIHEGKEHYGD